MTRGGPRVTLRHQNDVTCANTALIRDRVFAHAVTPHGRYTRDSRVRDLDPCEKCTRGAPELPPPPSSNIGFCPSLSTAAAVDSIEIHHCLRDNPIRREDFFFFLIPIALDSLLTVIQDAYFDIIINRTDTIFFFFFFLDVIPRERIR